LGDTAVNPPFLSPIFCAKNKIVITGYSSTRLDLGMLDLSDTVLKARIEKTFSNYQCCFSKIDGETFNITLSRLSSEYKPISLDDGEKLPDGFISEIDRIADDAPVINLLNNIFLEGLSRKASDIHIESGRDGAQIRFRIDGLLLPFRAIPLDRAEAVSARLKLLAHLNVLETRRPQDGHIDLKAEKRSIDVRISVVPTICGESIALRLLNSSDMRLSLDSLGFSTEQMETLRRILSQVSGLTLVTGPTGSGKTTTLAAILDQLNTAERKIISLEDPVEYRIAGITQIPVNEELGLTFDTLLRRVFRQDPDIIMIGEIRDGETAELAVRAALTGHIVFATLHTTDAVEAVFRLQNMGIPAFMTAAVLRAVIAQRLVRRVCGKCRTAGCGACSMTGYSGRVVISEIVEITRELASDIADGLKPEMLRKLLLNKGNKTFFDDAKEKIAHGITTDVEVRRELGGGDG
jgi:type II secretory ATPase GspE/PulE/Tfp pilus assembly ATPase PilB-like protein